MNRKVVSAHCKNQIKKSRKSFLFEVKVVLLQPEKWKDKQLNVTQICI